MSDTNRSGVPIDDGFPETAVNALAAREAYNKHLYRPATYLHKWWARRSGTTFRAILKQLVPQVAHRDYYAPGGLESQVILDPMMGGGTTLHEAIRLGANVVGADIDPIPVLQARATLRLATGREPRAVFETFIGALRAALADLYATTCPRCVADAEVQFALYGLRRACACGEAVFVDSLTLREEAGGARVALCAAVTAPPGPLSTRGEGEAGASRRDASADEPGSPEGAKPPLRTFAGSGMRQRQQRGKQEIGESPVRAIAVDAPRLRTKGQTACPACGERFRDLLDVPFPERYVPLVIAGQCPRHGAFFKPVDDADRARLARAAKLAAQIDVGDAASFAVPRGPKSDDLRRKGVRSFLDLFTPRQRLYLAEAARVLPTFPQQERLWLALLVSTSLEFNALLCGYKGGDARRPGAIRHVFSHHAYSFPYTALENNPIFSRATSGTLRRLFADRIARARRWALAPMERRVAAGRASPVAIAGEVDGGEEVASFAALREGRRRFLLLQADARTLPLPERSVDHVVTDPPYFDSVQYSDLSTFFRVWLRQFLPDVAEWTYDRRIAAVVEGNGEAPGRYAAALAAIWGECARVLKRPHGRLIFTFHHWRPEAWAALTVALQRAGFVLVNSYVVASENPVSVHIRALRALKHDAILVLAPRDAGGPARQWPLVEGPMPRSSAAFCRACGAALGWLLAAGLSEAAICAAWQRLLGAGT